MKHPGSTESPFVVPCTKKVKLCPPREDVVSFGWGDFPVLLGHSGWDAFPLPVAGPSSSPQSTTWGIREAPKQQPQAVCPCLFHGCQASVDSKQNCLPNVIETSDSDDDVDVDVDNDSTDMGLRKSLQIHVVVSAEQRITKRVRWVQFSTVQVREHAVTLGDHPLAESYPLSLDWAHAAVKETSVEDYEAKRVLLHPFLLANGLRARRTTPLERRLRLEEFTEESLSSMADQEDLRRLEAQRESLLDHPATLLTPDPPCVDADFVNLLVSRLDLLEMSL
jgi:hypothetical protein